MEILRKNNNPLLLSASFFTSTSSADSECYSLIPVELHGASDYDSLMLLVSIIVDFFRNSCLNFAHRIAWIKFNLASVCSMRYACGISKRSAYLCRCGRARNPKKSTTLTCDFNAHIHEVRRLLVSVCGFRFCLYIVFAIHVSHWQHRSSGSSSSSSSWAWSRLFTQAICQMCIYRRAIDTAVAQKSRRLIRSWATIELRINQLCADEVPSSKYFAPTMLVDLATVPLSYVTSFHFRHSIAVPQSRFPSLVT